MLRGNASEIMAVAGTTGDAKGVDSTKGLGWKDSLCILTRVRNLRLASAPAFNCQKQAQMPL